MDEKNERIGMIMKIEKQNKLFNQNKKILWIELDKGYILEDENINFEITHNTNSGKIERNFDAIIGMIVDKSININDISFNKYKPNNSNKYRIGNRLYHMKYGRNIGIYDIYL
tara:strand:+ start:1609 stop:1947 length:339 start_codon:yes stop_codon:yes gene_type:complete